MKKRMKNWVIRALLVVLCIILVTPTIPIAYADDLSTPISLFDENSKQIEAKLDYQGTNRGFTSFLYIVENFSGEKIKVKAAAGTNYKIQKLNVFGSETTIPNDPISLEKYTFTYNELNNSRVKSFFFPDYEFNSSWQFAGFYFRQNKSVYAFVFKTGEVKSDADKSKLLDAITAAPKVDGSDNSYHHENDRYNGNDTSQKGFWEEYKAARSNAEKELASGVATKDSVTNAITGLNSAISKLIPSTQANTTMLYEALQGLLTENTRYTAVSWDNYVKAKETAQTLFDGLFTAGTDGKRVATDQNTKAKQGEIETAATVLKAAKADLLGSKGLEERLLLWNSAAQWLLAQDQQVQNGQYSNAQDWKTAYANLENAIADGDGYQTQSKYNAYTSSIVALSAAYYNLQDSNTSDITVHVRVADNFGAMFPEYAIQDAKTATFDQNVTLGQGNKTISAMLSAMGYDDTPKKRHRARVHSTAKAGRTRRSWCISTAP